AAPQVLEHDVATAGTPLEGALHALDRQVPSRAVQPHIEAVGHAQLESVRAGEGVRGARVPGAQADPPGRASHLRAIVGKVVALQVAAELDAWLIPAVDGHAAAGLQIELEG